MTYPTPTRNELVTAAQLADAVLSILTMYDDQRHTLGHDFGCGQRAHELIRVRKEREHAITNAHRFGYGMGLGDLAATPDQMREAFVRLSTERLRRYDRDAHTSRTYTLALRAWRVVQREVEAQVKSAERALLEARNAVRPSS
jgi:hypothetical protein